MGRPLTWKVVLAPVALRPTASVIVGSALQVRLPPIASRLMSSVRSMPTVTGPASPGLVKFTPAAPGDNAPATAQVTAHEVVQGAMLQLTRAVRLTKPPPSREDGDTLSTPKVGPGGRTAWAGQGTSRVSWWRCTVDAQA